MARPLSEPHLRVWWFIAEFYSVHTIPPTYREIQNAMSWKSTNSAMGALRRLVTAGLVERLPGQRARGYRLKRWPRGETFNMGFRTTSRGTETCCTLCATVAGLIARDPATAMQKLTDAGWRFLRLKPETTWAACPSCQERPLPPWWRFAEQRRQP